MKKTSTFFIALLLLLSSLVKAQNIDLNKPLPLDKDVITGTLPNGFTYYVRHNEKPKNRAFLWLVINAGSVCEDEDQLGLAHFMEHMQFNGTKHFPKDRLIKFLESTGMKFGADLNAYTSFDETVYQLEIPLDNPEFLDSALLIMYDWSHLASLETEEIEKERGVIHEEWRLGKGADDRLLRQTLPVIFWGSKYAEREPIGKPEIFDNFDPDVLRRFHKDWYRPDLEAIIVVGDIDAQEVAKKIEKLFQDFKGPENPRPRVYPELPQHNDVKVKVATDKEARYPMVQIIYKHPMKKLKTYGDYKDMLVTSLMEEIMNQKFQKDFFKKSSPFIYAGTSFSHLIDKTDALYLFAVAKNQQIDQSVEYLLTEAKRMKQNDISQATLENAKKALMKKYEKALKEKDKTESINYIYEYKQHFSVENTPYMGIDFEYNLAKTFIPQITAEEIKQKAKELITDKNMVIVVTAPEKETVKVPTEEELLQIVEKVKNMQISEEQAETNIESLITENIKPGKVVKEEKDEKVGTTVWTLSNGMKVVLKTTQFKNDQILMSAFSKGGYSLYPEKKLLEARLAAEFIQNSGLGNISPVELTNFLATKDLNVTPYISQLYEGFDGSSSVEDFETMMQMVYLYFTAPRYDEEAFDAYRDRITTVLENKANDPEAVWQDSLVKVLTSGSPYSRPLNANDYRMVNYKKMYKIFKKRFSDPASFTFVFVGNIEPEKAKPIIEKYLGSLKAKDKKEQYVDRSSGYPVGQVIRKTVYKGTEDKSIAYMVYTQNMQNSYKNKLLISGISEILTDRLLKSIREEQSLTYSIAAFPSLRSEPKAQSGIGIYYSSSPDTVFYIVDQVNKISEEIQKNITDKEFQATIAKLKKEHETNLQENRYWRSQLVAYYKGTSKAEALTDFDKIVESITKDDLKNAAKKFLNPKSYAVVALKPVQKK